MASEAQDNKTCSQCAWFTDGNGSTMGTCSAMYYDLSLGNHTACEHFEEVIKCKNSKREQ